jgi:hypothetical protein
VQRRNSWGLLALSILSVGAFAIAWLCVTRVEMNRLGARIPSPWLLVLPVTAIYWAWRWADGVRHVTARRTSRTTAFVLVLLGPPGQALVQASFNRLQPRPQAMKMQHLA